MDPSGGDTVATTRLSKFRLVGRRDNLLKSLLYFGRGSRIRTCDLKYPKLPRYRAALCPDFSGWLT
jgi:hypothetical protein